MCHEALNGTVGAVGTVSQVCHEALNGTDGAVGTESQVCHEALNGTVGADGRSDGRAEMSQRMNTVNSTCDENA